MNLSSGATLLGQALAALFALAVSSSPHARAEIVDEGDPPHCAEVAAPSGLRVGNLRLERWSTIESDELRRVLELVERGCMYGASDLMQSQGDPAGRSREARLVSAIFRSRHDPEFAAQVSASMLDEDPQDAAAALVVAERHFVHGNHLGAHLALEKVEDRLASDLDNYVMQLRLDQVAIPSEASRRALSEVLERQDMPRSLRRSAGMTLVSTARSSAEAETTLRTLVGVDAGALGPEPHQMLAFLLFGEQRFREAVDFLEGVQKSEQPFQKHALMFLLAEAYLTFSTATPGPALFAPEEAGPKARAALSDIRAWQCRAALQEGRYLRALELLGDCEKLPPP